jgi:hypothetical protein
MSTPMQLSDIQKKNCGADGSAFLMILRAPPRKTGFNPFGSQKSKQWAIDEVKRVCARLVAEIEEIKFQKRAFKEGKGFFCSGILIRFKPGMHPKAVKKMMKGKSVNIKWRIHVRNDHDAEKFGEPIDEWEWRFVPAKFEYLTKEQLVERRNKLRQESKVQELVLSSDSESEEDEEEDDCF